MAAASSAPLPRRAGFRVWIPQLGQHYPNQLQQQSLNQECHVRSKGSSSHHHVWLRIFRAALLPGRHWSRERDPCAHINICKAAAEWPALHPGAACQGPLGPLSVLMEQSAHRTDTLCLVARCTHQPEREHSWHYSQPACLHKLVPSSLCNIDGGKHEKGPPPLRFTM